MTHMSNPISGTWIDDHEGIPNGWMEKYVSDLSGNKIIQNWTFTKLNGTGTFYRTDGGNETIKTVGGDDHTATHNFGNSFGKFIPTTYSGQTEIIISQVFYLTEQELNKPLPIYFSVWQNLYNISTLNREFKIRIGYSLNSSELHETTVASSAIVSQSVVGSTTITSTSKTVYFTIYFTLSNANSSNDYFLVDAFGLFRALVSGSELAIQRNFNPTTYSSEALISNTSWSSEALISNTSWS